MGVGVSYSQYDQGEEHYNYFLIRPSINLNYKIGAKGNLRYTFELTPNSPSLSSLSNNRQQSNEFEYHVGNPKLKPYSRMTQMLTFSYRHPQFYIENTSGYIYSKNAIMEDITRHADSQGKSWFDFSYDNQKSLREFWNYTNLQVFVIPNTLTLEGDILILFLAMKGRIICIAFTGVGGMSVSMQTLEDGTLRHLG